MKGYRTIIFNVLMLGVFLANQFSGDLGITEEQIGVASDVIDKLIGAALVFGNVGLRLVTDTPVGKK